MRLSRPLVCLLFFACLAGCSQAPAAPSPPLADHTGNYETVAVIHQSGLDANAIISQQSPDACSVRFTSPETLEGMTFTFRQDTVTVSYNSLDFQFDPRAVPGGSVAKIMVTALGKAMQGDGVTAEQSDTGSVLTGSVEAGSFQLDLDGDSDRPLKLLVPSEELEIEFENFIFLD